MTTTTTEQTYSNGVNVAAILGAREVLAGAPAAAQFQWKAEAEWVNGTHTRTTVEKFFGLGEEQLRTQTFVVDTDHPEIFASQDNGMTPPELALVALAGCIGAGIATVATNRGIELRSVKAGVSADMDLQGTLGIDANVRNGFSGIQLRYEIDADASHEDIEAVVAQSQKRSAVYDMLTNPTAVSVTVA